MLSNVPCFQPHPVLAVFFTLPSSLLNHSKRSHPLTPFSLYLSSTLGWVQNSNPNLGLEMDARQGTISPSVVSYSCLGAWARTWRGWRWSWVGGTGGGSWTGGSAVVCCWMNCGISMACRGDRIVSSPCGSMACGDRTVSSRCGLMAGACGGGALALGGSVAGCFRACCAFCSCRCHREGRQQSSRFFMRTVIPCPLGC